MSSTPHLRIPISPGELLDKISILEIKAARITHPKKLQNVKLELQALHQVRDQSLPTSDQISEMFQELKLLNEALWEIEDAIRVCEARQDFGEQFISLARSVYLTNDQRSAVKRKINECLGSTLIEEKSFSTDA